MKKGLFLMIALFLSAPFLRAQETIPLEKNIIFGEAFGIGGWYSLNYERVLFRLINQRLMVSAAWGASAYNRPEDFQSLYFLERLNVAYGYKGFYLELGADLVLNRGRGYSFRDYWLLWNKQGLLFPHAGLRFQKKGWPFFKAYIFPIHNDAYTDFFLYEINKSWNGPEWYWWGGVSVGYAF